MHYTALILCGDGEWRLYNDLNVTTVKIKELKEYLLNENNFMAFYKKISH